MNAPIGRALIAVSPADAAQLLSMSRDSFDRYVRDELRLIRRGRLVLVPVRELEAWVTANASRTLPEETVG
jgi:hypothetical protein